MLKWLLTKLFAHEVAGMEPRIVELTEPIQLVGVEMATNLDRVKRDVPDLGRRFLKLKETHQIPDRKEPWAIVAVTKNFDPASRDFSYVVGDVVTSLARVPDELTGFEVPLGTYAVFPVRPKSRIGWGVASTITKRYAYNYWLPRSPYQAGGSINDFEYHDERCTRNTDPEIDLYVAVTRREGS